MPAIGPGFQAGTIVSLAAAGDELVRVLLTILCCLFAGGALADDALLLRCTATDPLNRRDGRHLIIKINEDRTFIHVRDYHVRGVTKSGYTLAYDGDDLIRGFAIGSQAFEMITIDRLSGRITLSWDASATADEVWNEDKRMLGGFNLEPGERLWLGAHYQCDQTERKF